MNIKLYTDSGYFDLYPDETIVLKRTLLSEDRVGASTSNFTKDFTIPATKNNSYLLGHYEEKSNENLQNPNKKIDAYMDIGGVDTIDGSIQILSITYKTGKPNNYTIVFYSNASDFKAKVGSDLLEDIDWSYFNFEWKSNTVTGTWLTNGRTYIPIMSWDRFYNIGKADDDDISVSSTGVLVDELRVAFDLLKFVTQIFEHYGYYLSFSGNVNDYFNKCYIIPITNIPTLDTSGYQVEVYNDTAQAIPTVLGPSGKILMPTEVTDPDGDWDTATSYYTASFSGVHSFSFECEFTGVYREGYVQIDAYDVTASTSPSGVDLQLYDDIDSGTYSPTLTAGHEYYFRWVFVPTEPVGASCSYIRMKTTSIPINPFGLTFEAVMPEYSVIDFVSGFLSAFNLTLLNVGNKQYEIRDYESLYSGILDLSEYADQTTITYKTNEVYKELNFKHADSDDYLNEAFNQTADREYGSYGYYPDVDFSSGKLEKESIFNVFPPAYMDNNTTLRHYFNFNEDLEKPENMFLLFYKNTTVDTTVDYYIQTGVSGSGTPTFLNSDSYSNYSMVQDSISTGVSNTLSYGAENPFVGAVAENTIFTVFFKQWILDLYDNQGYTTEVTLPAKYDIYLEIKGLAIIYLNGFYHYILEDSYDIGKEMISLKLLKVNVNPLASDGDYNSDYNCDYYDQDCLVAVDGAGAVLVDHSVKTLIY